MTRPVTAHVWEGSDGQLLVESILTKVLSIKVSQPWWGVQWTEVGDSVRPDSAPGDA